MKEKINTEEKIIEAAGSNFIKYGFVGARMQHIANDAGINKAMLHYYFKNKQLLFEKVFREKANQLFGQVFNSINPETNLEELITLFVDQYLSFLQKNSKLPLFVINELSRHPELIEKVFLPAIAPIINRFQTLLHEEVEAGNAREIPIQHLIMNMISMCVFPILARPLVTRFLAPTDEAFQTLIQERKKMVTQCILNDLKL